MNFRERNESDLMSPQSVERPFRIVTVHDSPHASSEADHASEIVLRELGDDVVVDKTNWNIRVLSAPQMRDRAAGEAARADVILLALSDNTVSDALREWVQQWEKARVTDGGLLALIPSGDSETGGDLADFLYETAVSANMDFLCRKQHRLT